MIINDSIQGTALNIVTDGMKDNYLDEGGFLMIGDIAMSFDKKNSMPGIEVYKSGAKFMIRSDFPIRYLAMSEVRKSARQSGVAEFTLSHDSIRRTSTISGCDFVHSAGTTIRVQGSGAQCETHESAFKSEG